MMPVLGFRYESLEEFEAGDYRGGVRGSVCGGNGPTCPMTPGPCGCGVRLVEDPLELCDYVIDQINRWRVGRAMGGIIGGVEPFAASPRLIVHVRSTGLVLPGDTVEDVGEAMADPPGTWRCEGVTLESRTGCALPGLTTDVAICTAEAMGFEVVQL